MDNYIKLHKLLIINSLRNIKSLILMLVLGTFFAMPCFAQNNLEGMRFLTVNALVQYGQRLYDRGDYKEATAVFSHVLTFDDHQAQALEYLKDMGHSPAPGLPITAFGNDIGSTVSLMDTKSLKEAIEAKKQVIEKLQAQITQMRANIASQSSDVN